MAGPDQPGTNVLPAHLTCGNRPLVAVNASSFAKHRPAGDEVGQREGRILAAPIRRSVGALTCLPALGRVYAVQPNALAMDFDGVAVDDGCLASYRFSLGGSYAGDQEQRDKYLQ